MNGRKHTLLGFIITAALVLVCLGSCSAFFLPELPRTNPYDDEAVVAPIENLDANVPGADTIELTWTVPSDRAPSSLAVIINSIQLPKSIDDGDRYDIDDPSVGSWTHEGVEPDKTYYYGVWSVSEDGTEVGPIYTKEMIEYVEENLEPLIDGYTDSMPSTYFFSPTMNVTRAASITSAVSLIKYDLSGLPAIVETVELELNVTDVFTAETVEIYRITQDWDTSSITFMMASDPNFYGNESPIATFYASAVDIYTFDMREIILDMAQENNYGFVLHPANVPDLDISMSTTEGARPPYLKIVGYRETY